MKIIIISDVHNNLLNLEKVINYASLNNINKIICCGDLASLETLDFFTKKFLGDIYFVFGNMDTEHMPEMKNVEMYKNANIFPEYGEANFLNKKIAFVHFPDLAKKLAESGKYEIVFYGHTHKPWEEKVGETTILNPGSVTGDRFPPTFAFWDTLKNDFSLILINEL